MPDQPAPPIVMPTDETPGELQIDPAAESPVPFPTPGSNWTGPSDVQPPDESENYSAGTWIALGAFAAIGAFAYRYRKTLKKALT